jgi:hypothetical protein
MLKFLGQRRQFCDGIARRDFIQAGVLAIGGLTMADLLRSQAAAKEAAATAGVRGSASSHKAVIMIYLPGGPTHIDTYDPKPEAAAEFRGEFKPTRTSVPGMQLCELLPRQAAIADKLAVLRGVRFTDEHDAHLLMTGFPERVRRPAFGSVVSKLKSARGAMPPYVSLMNRPMDEDPEYCGAAHRPFLPSGPGMQDLTLVSGVGKDRLEDRKTLLNTFDSLRRDVDAKGSMAGMDAFTARALDMITSPKTRQAFDVSHEPDKVRDRYGKECAGFLQARRLVEAGVSVVSVAFGGWDTHSNNFDSMRKQLPRLDQGFSALVNDLHERGLADDVAVVMWGEFGRTPRVNSTAGRDHWSQAGFAVVAGGGFKTGQVIGETDGRGERSKGEPVTPQNVLCSLYGHLGIDPSTTLTDGMGRPMYLLDDRRPVPGLA